jgi:precorrin-6Y C5,15-methyltransferase (decarboxylating)
LASAEKVYVIGMGDDGLAGLSPSVRQMVESADLLIGQDALLKCIPKSKAERLELGNDLDGVVDRIRKAEKSKIAILSIGDPLFYGTARYLCDRVGKERFEVVPHVSSMQLAFARVKESWDEAVLTNLASQTIDRVIEKIRSAEKVGAFTTDEVSPAILAKALLDAQIDYFTAYVCENLGSRDERVTQGELVEIAAMEFSPLNVVILVRKPDVPDRPTQSAGKRLFGNSDTAFLQSQPKHGLLTPSEIRAIALSELDLGPRSIVWDVGAGSGSVAIECAQIARDGHVYAIEMDPEDHVLIRSNAEQFGVKNLVPVLGMAPAVWKDLPDPDAIFIGGTGRKVHDIIAAAILRLKPGGRIVAAMGSIENVAEVHEALQSAAGDAKVWLLQFARGNFQLDSLRFESINPTFLLSAIKPRRESPSYDV